MPPSSFSEDDNKSYITYRQLAAALEVFGRETQLFETVMSYRASGIFKLRTVGDFINHLRVPTSLESGLDEEIEDRSGDGLSIFRLYGADRQLAAIAIAPFVHQERISIDADGNVTLIDHECGLIPDPEVITVTSSKNGATIFIEMLDIDLRDDMRDSPNAVFHIIDSALPDRNVRTGIIERFMAAIASSSPHP